MNIIEQIQKLRAAFESAALKFADYKLGELTVRIEGEPVVGAKVTLLGADGNPMDATGEHAIPSLGTVVVANGVIETITPDAVVEVETEAEAPVEAVVEEVAAIVEVIAPEAPAEVVAEISAEVANEIIEKLDEMATEIVEMKKKMSAGENREKQMFALIEQLTKLPTAPEQPKGFVGEFKKNESNRFDKLAETIKQMKTQKTN